MILIADSGSTNTVWILSDGGESRSFTTPGLNPYHITAGDICAALDREFPAGLAADVRELHFYGAGCTEARIPVMREIMEGFFPAAEISVANDLLGACRGLCGSGAGIVCILGTGSNSCLYDGERITANTPPLGYILGDEGSGTALGRIFAADCLKNLMPESLKAAFLETYGPTQENIIERVYRQPAANRFLAGFAPFIALHRHRPEVSNLVTGEFRNFLRRNVAQYGVAGSEVHFAGSVAWHFSDLLAEAVAAEGFRIGKTVQSPAEGIAAYHNRKRRKP